MAKTLEFSPKSTDVGFTSYVHFNFVHTLGTQQLYNVRRM